MFMCRIKTWLEELSLIRKKTVGVLEGRFKNKVTLLNSDDASLFESAIISFINQRTPPASGSQDVCGAFVIVLFHQAEGGSD